MHGTDAAIGTGGVEGAETRFLGAASEVCLIAVWVIERAASGKSGAAREHKVRTDPGALSDKIVAQRGEGR